MGSFEDEVEAHSREKLEVLEKKVTEVEVV